jgi:hypothetical protein
MSCKSQLSHQWYGRSRDGARAHFDCTAHAIESQNGSAL